MRISPPARRDLVLIATMLAVASLAALDAQAEFSSFENAIGQVAPEWQLESLDGRTRSLLDFKGRPVVLNFWATWCAPCRVESKWLTEIAAQHRATGLIVLGVSMDEPTEDAEVRRFVKTFGAEYTILLHGQPIAASYGGVRYLPQTFFIDRGGRIVHASRGAQSKETLEADVQRILK